MSNIDREHGFKKHREANFRIRRGSAEEIEKIACRAFGKVPDGFASLPNSTMTTNGGFW